MISYSGLTNYGKATLPSVEMGLGTMNILKDPPKSIMTRKIEKVGENNDLANIIGDSNDRAEEYITQYARGVNPMVGVSYSNHGTNGGSNGVLANRTAAKMPYTLGAAGFNFRPPVVGPQELLPLSRKPRAWTHQYTSKDFADYRKKLTCAKDAEHTRETKNSLLKANVRPTSVYRIEKPLEKPSDVKYKILDSLKVSANSGVRTLDITQQHVEKMHKHLNKNLTFVKAQTQKGSQNKSRKVNANLNTERFTHDTLKGDMNSNLSQNISKTPIDDVVNIDTDKFTKDTFTINLDTPQTHSKAQDYIHNDIELEKNLPNHIASTNSYRQGVDKNTQSREVSLNRNTPVTSMSSNHGTIGRQAISDRGVKNIRPKLQYGGFNNGGFKPSGRRIQDEMPNIDSRKLNLNKAAYNELMAR